PHHEIVSRGGARLKHLTDQAPSWIFQRTDLQTIAQKIGQNLLARRVGDVTRVTLTPFRWCHWRSDAAGFYTTKRIEQLQPFGIALDEIIIHRHDVARLPAPTRQDGRQTGGQSLAFAGCHLSEITAVQRQSAHKLDSKGPQT